MFGFRCCWMKRFKNVLVRPIRDVLVVDQDQHRKNVFGIGCFCRDCRLMKIVLFMVSDIWNMNYNPSNNSNLVNFIWFVTILSIIKSNIRCSIDSSSNVKIIVKFKIHDQWKLLNCDYRNVCEFLYWKFVVKIIEKIWNPGLLTWLVLLLTHKCARCLGFEGLKPACRRSIQRTALNLNRFHRGRPCAWSFLARC
jgi:hypothetical protein